VKPKKTDALQHPEELERVGLLVNWPPGLPGCPLASQPKIQFQKRLMERPSRCMLPISQAISIPMREQGQSIPDNFACRTLPAGSATGGARLRSS
jgi:hypothetical protein